MGDGRQQLATGIGVFCILGAFLYFVVKPQNARLSELRQQVAGLKLQIDNRTHLGSAALATELRLQQCNQRLASMEHSIPTNVRLGPFLEELSKSSAQSKLRHVDVSPESPYAVDGLGVLPIRMSFESSFTSLYDFLKRVESMDRMVYVEQIGTKRQEEGTASLATELTMHVFYELSEEN